MASFFGESTECKFNMDPLCNQIGGVSLEDRGYSSESAWWPFVLVIAPPLLYIVLNLQNFLAWFR